MKKSLYCFIVSLNTMLLVAAQGIPPFSPQSSTLRIPAFLPGIMNDASALLNNDTLIYTLHIQVLGGNGFRIPPNTRAPALASPWETLVEMADAYAKKSAPRIAALYNTASKDDIKKLLDGPQAAGFFTFVSRAAKANLKLVACMAYKEGFLAFTRDDLYGLHQNYIVKENGKFKLSALEDKSPTGWNVGLYFKFLPKPMIPITGVALPDSLTLSDSIVVRVALPETGRYVVLYMNNPGGPVSLLIQDNGPGDINRTARQVAFRLKGMMFLAAGTYNFYMSAFNFPLQRVSKNIIIEQAKYTIRIK